MTMGGCLDSEYNKILEIKWTSYVVVEHFIILYFYCIISFTHTYVYEHTYKHTEYFFMTAVRA